MKAGNATQHEFRVVPAGEFKATCLQLMEEVQNKPLTIIMTKRGRPVAQMMAPPAGLRLAKPSVELPSDTLPAAAARSANDPERSGKKRDHGKRRRKKKKK